MKAKIQSQTAKTPAVPELAQLLLRRNIGPRCAVRRGSQLNGWPRLRRGRASGCAHRAHPLPQTGGPALPLRPVMMGLHGDHEP
jgi:hypothetical protein